MARQLRVFAPDGIFHVSSHAVGNEALFSDRIDCATYLDKIEITARRFEWHFLGFCLLGTHAHVLLRTIAGDLGPGMQRLQGTYARAFNKRRHRRGALFRTRYDAVHVETDEHLLEEIRYIALNPVRAGLVRRPEDWLWSSYGSLIGVCPTAATRDRDLLRLFARVSRTARAHIRDFVESGLERPLLAAA